MLRQHRREGAFVPRSEATGNVVSRPVTESTPPSAVCVPLATWRDVRLRGRGCWPLAASFATPCSPRRRKLARRPRRRTSGGFAAHEQRPVCAMTNKWPSPRGWGRQAAAVRRVTMRRTGGRRRPTPTGSRMLTMKRAIVNGAPRIGSSQTSVRCQLISDHAVR